MGREWQRDLAQQFPDGRLNLVDRDAAGPQYLVGRFVEELALEEVGVELLVRVLELHARFVEVHGQKGHPRPHGRHDFYQTPGPREDPLGQEHDQVVAVVHAPLEVLQVRQVLRVQEEGRVEKMCRALLILLDELIHLGAHQRRLSARLDLVVREETKVLMAGFHLRQDRHLSGRTPLYLFIDVLVDEVRFQGALLLLRERLGHVIVELGQVHFHQPMQVRDVHALQDFSQVLEVMRLQVPNQPARAVRLTGGGMRGAPAAGQRP
mmetsp:Transcript_5750/g.15488  ORF Transcript_5750/g.15488 Transcript_5750/m.15488 type:complete len:265 (+) Transcript_5750:273-1067(+)